MARTMLMHEMMSMVMPQKWRKPMMSVRVRMMARMTKMQILRCAWVTNGVEDCIQEKLRSFERDLKFARRRRTTAVTQAMASRTFLHNSSPMISSVSQAA